MQRSSCARRVVARRLGCLAALLFLVVAPAAEARPWLSMERARHAIETHDARMVAVGEIEAILGHCYRRSRVQVDCSVTEVCPVCVRGRRESAESFVVGTLSVFAVLTAGHVLVRAESLAVAAGSWDMR
jgi:hypothetical protein